MLFNTVINPDAMTGTVGRGPPLAPLLTPFCLPAHRPQLCSLEGEHGRGKTEAGAPMWRVMAESRVCPEHLTQTWAGSAAPPSSQGG